MVDEENAMFAIVEIALEVERTVGGTIGDDELQAVKTLRDFARLVERRLPEGPKAGVKAVEMVRTAALKIDWFTVTAADPDFDVPLLDALRPGRWEQEN